MFFDTEGKTQYRMAGEVREVAQKLIELFHPHLFGCRIEYVFVSKPPLRLGKPLAGRARKVTGLTAFLATPNFEGEPEPFFLIEITKPIWDTFTAEQRIALVNHELKHCDVDGETGNLTIRPHDEELFLDEIIWHGLWNESLQQLGEVVMISMERGVSAVPLKNNREQSNAVQKGSKRKSRWKAAQVAGAH
jgi:Putative phage metallopeptidase